ncbi:type VII toxin-antitoxin system MntA family adenylyltransferase antitoxin, partial [Haloferax profundi]|uniref:type VII toxin-antitoxin system MntA family adenylyltransferase antitoxin n=1 Tax=Haloferax profundi TaxID=1544718 RepID=UPI000AC40B02
MRTAETTEVADDLPLETIQAILREHSVRLAILFGSHASGKTHPTSDIDIAVELDEVQHDDSAYNDAFFGLSADLSENLGTDDVDLVDVHTLTPRVAKSVFDDGILLVGEL